MDNPHWFGLLLWGSINFMESFFLQPLKASIDFEDATQPELITSARALGLGNAYLAKVDDSAAAFYNPAGLGTVRSFHMHLTNLHIEANKGFLRAATDGNVTGTFSRFKTSFDLDKAREVLEENRGQLLMARFHLAPNITSRYFSLGFLYSHQLRGLIGEEENSLFEFAKRVDHGPYASFNLSFFGGIFKLGATGVYLNRKEIFDERELTENLSLSPSDYNQGQALYLIGGGRLTLPLRGLPTIALKLNNISHTSFRRGDDSAGAPEKIKPSWDGGFSLTPQIAQTLRLHLELGYRDITSQYEELRTSRRLAGGIEIDLRRTAFLRLGYGDGFGSAGIGIRTPRLELDLTTYGVDRAHSGFRKEEDRRYIFSLSSSL